MALEATFFAAGVDGGFLSEFLQKIFYGEKAVIGK